MSLEVIGAGFGRTGTMSLEVALEELGFGPCYHMSEVFENPEHAEQWEAAVEGKPVDWEKLFTTTVRNGNPLKLRFFAALGREPEVELALI
jgi:hypothetical protein